MQFSLAAVLSVAFAAMAFAAPVATIKARQTIDFGDDGRPSMSGANGEIIAYSNPNAG